MAPRRSRLWLCALAALGLCALAKRLVLPEAFVAPVELSGRDDSLVAMQGGARRQNRRNHIKKRGT